MSSYIFSLFNRLFEHEETINEETINEIINESTDLEFKILLVTISSDKVKILDYINDFIKNNPKLQNKKFFMAGRKNIDYMNKKLDKLINFITMKGIVEGTKIYEKPIEGLQKYKSSMNEYYKKIELDDNLMIQRKKEIQELVENIYTNLKLPEDFYNDKYKKLLKICLTHNELEDVDVIKKEYQDRYNNLIAFIEDKTSKLDEFDFDSDGFEYAGDRLLKIIVDTQYKEYKKSFLSEVDDKIINNYKQHIQTNVFLHKIMEKIHITDKIDTLYSVHYATIIPNGGGLFKFKKTDWTFGKEDEWGADFLEAIIFTLFLYSDESFESLLEKVVNWWSEITYELDKFTTEITEFKKRMKLLFIIDEKKIKSDGTFIEEYIDDRDENISGNEIFENMDSD